MKYWIPIFLVLLVFGILFYLFFPSVNKERICYETGQAGLDTISTDILARGISLSTQCERSADVLYALEGCIREATKSSTIADLANDTILRIVATVRLSRANLWMIKAAHNEKCADFSSAQLP